jgi:L-iditol 2-dehydrogenase
MLEPSLCDAGLGCYGLGMPGAPLDFQGGYAQYIHLSKPDSVVLKMDVPAEAAVFFDPLAVGIHAVERIGNLPVGSSVVVQGAGAIGIASLVAARERGAHRVIVVGAPQSRLELALEFGADEVINIEEVQDPSERVRRVREQTEMGYGADAVLECTGVPAAVPEGIDMLRRGGAYVVLGHFTDVGDVALNPFRHFNHKQIALYGSWGCHIGETIRARTIIEAGQYDFGALVSHRLPLERVQDAMDALSGDLRLGGEEVRKIAISGLL